MFTTFEVSQTPVTCDLRVVTIQQAHFDRLLLALAEGYQNLNKSTTR
jgi:hypothetical protein